MVKLVVLVKWHHRQQNLDTKSRQKWRKTCKLD